jgi:hypothetical protein
MTCFTIKIEFATPPILSRPPTLDSVLAFCLYDACRYEGMDHEHAIAYAHANIPLQTIAGVAAGSVALIPHCETTPHTIIQSMESFLHRSVSPEKFILPNEKKRSNTPDYYKPATAEMRQVNVSQLAKEGLFVGFLGQGNITRVNRLLESLEYLGKKAGSFGKIKGKVVATEVEEYENFGVVSRTGIVLRPVPQQMLATLNVSDPQHAVAYESIKVPYWQTPRMLCCVPPGRTLPFDMVQDLVDGVV